MKKRVFFVVQFLLLSFVLLGQNQREAIYYEVKEKDNLSIIAQNNNVQLDSLYQWNNLNEKSIITIGQQIIVGWKEVVSEEVEGDSVAPGQGDERQSVGTSSVGEQSQRNPKATDNKKDNKDKKAKREEKSNPQGEQDERFSWGTLLFDILLGAILGILLLYFFFVKKVKAEHECNERDLSQRIAELRDEKTKLNSEVLRLQSKIQSIEKEKQQLFDENVALGEEIDRLKSIGHEVNDNRVEKTKAVSPQTSGSSTVLYADAIIDNYFVKVRETPDEDSIFVLHLNGENSTDFSIYKSAYQRVVANPSFLEGCEKQVLGDTMQLEIVSKGKAQRELSNGKWKVINKLNVIIR